MQTATVDIRRLQILNDSINRTIDALNQVRLSVYGTVAPNALGVTPAVGGLAHAAAQNPFVQNALANQFANPFANPFTGTNPFTTTNAFNNPYATFANAGLGHSGFGSYADPYATQRIAQTFPFVQWGYSPFGWPTV